MMNAVLTKISVVISVVSIAVVIYGTVIAVIEFVRNEIRRCNNTFDFDRLRTLRVNLGSYILLGLELLIASDILKTILDPGLEELGILGGVVALRTILSVFLNKELGELDKEHRDELNRN